MFNQRFGCLVFHVNSPLREWPIEEPSDSYHAEARRIKRGFSQGRGRRCGHGAAQNRMLGSSGRGIFRDAHGFERVDLQTGRHQAWKRTTAKAVGRLSE